jgi:hypothetical protein
VRRAVALASALRASEEFIMTAIPAKAGIQYCLEAGYSLKDGFQLSLE